MSLRPKLSQRAKARAGRRGYIDTPYSAWLAGRDSFPIVFLGLDIMMIIYSPSYDDDMFHVEHFSRAGDACAYMARG